MEPESRRVGCGGGGGEGGKRHRGKEREREDRWFEPERRNNQKDGAEEVEGGRGGLLKETALIYPFTYIKLPCISAIPFPSLSSHFFHPLLLLFWLGDNGLLS